MESTSVSDRPLLRTHVRPNRTCQSHIERHQKGSTGAQCPQLGWARRACWGSAFGYLRLCWQPTGPPMDTEHGFGGLLGQWLICCEPCLTMKPRQGQSHTRGLSMVCSATASGLTLVRSFAYTEFISHNGSQGNTDEDQTELDIQTEPAVVQQRSKKMSWRNTI